MKITPNTLLIRANEHVRSAMSRAQPAESGTTSDVLIPSPGTSPAKSAAPAGLAKVMARLQAIPNEDRTAGQNTAADRISRNIERYLQVQAIVPSAGVIEKGEVA